MYLLILQHILSSWSHNLKYLAAGERLRASCSTQLKANGNKRKCLMQEENRTGDRTPLPQSKLPLGPFFEAPAWLGSAILAHHLAPSSQMTASWSADFSPVCQVAPQCHLTEPGTCGQAQVSVQQLMTLRWPKR